MRKESRIYVGCSLTQAPEQFRDEVAGYKESLRDAGYEVFDFIGLENGTAADVYRWDIEHCVSDCDILVGVCDYPSLGLGWELNEATRLGKEVLAIAHKQSSISRLILGAADVRSNVHFAHYDNLLDTLPIIDDLASNL
jgi:hypothetical protein